jgi:hypothetical protein
VNTTLSASPTFRRNVLLAALFVALLELAALGLLWRLGAAIDPDTDRRAALLFVLLGSVFTLQAMAVVGIGWIVVAMSRTRLNHDVTGLTLDHPWRHWRGDWPDVRHAWEQNGWLVMQLRDQWRRWYIRAAGDRAALNAIRTQLPPGAWLEGAARHRHLARTTLPIVLASAVVGGGLLWMALDVLRRL